MARTRSLYMSSCLCLLAISPSSRITDHMSIFISLVHCISSVRLTFMRTLLIVCKHVCDSHTRNLYRLDVLLTRADTDSPSVFCPRFAARPTIFLLKWKISFMFSIDFFYILDPILLLNLHLV